MEKSGLSARRKRRFNPFGAFRRYDHGGRKFNTPDFALGAIALWILLTAIVPVAAIAAPQQDEMKILAFGDSLTAGLGLRAADAFPAQLEAALHRAGLKARVQNGGVSGDTTAGGLARIGWLLGDDPDSAPDLVILELGANDGLRGVDPAVTRRNLEGIYQRIHATGARVLLMGMQGLANMGPDYATAFNALFPSLAVKWGVGFYPFFLKGVAARPEYSLPDGLHPNAQGVAVIVEGVLPLVKQEYRLWKAKDGQ